MRVRQALARPTEHQQARVPRLRVLPVTVRPNDEHEDVFGVQGRACCPAARADGREEAELVGAEDDVTESALMHLRTAKSSGRVVNCEVSVTTGSRRDLFDLHHQGDGLRRPAKQTNQRIVVKLASCAAPDSGRTY